LRILEIEELETVRHRPTSHPFVERLIGTMRREFLDHVLFWIAVDLERKLVHFQSYYNAQRSHASLEGYTPLTFAKRQPKPAADLNDVQWVSGQADAAEPARCPRHDGCIPRGLRSRADAPLLIGLFTQLTRLRAVSHVVGLQTSEEATSEHANEHPHERNQKGCLSSGRRGHPDGFTVSQTRGEGIDVATANTP
jgi:hypothetical protein